MIEFLREMIVSNWVSAVAGFMLGFSFILLCHALRRAYQEIEYLREALREAHNRYLRLLFQEYEEKRKNEDILEDEMNPLMPLQTIQAKAHLGKVNYGKIYRILDEDSQFVMETREYDDEIAHDKQARTFSKA